MKILGIIPARFESTRFPGKPLADIDGMPLIQRVYNQVSMSDYLDEVIIATDHPLIMEKCLELDLPMEETQSYHKSGIERIAEVARRHSEYDAIVYIHCDEPFIMPVQIDLLAKGLMDGRTEITTLAKVVRDYEELTDPEVVKIVFGMNHEAIYLSRQPIPYFVDATKEEWLMRHQYHKHIGLYGFRRETLLEVSQINESQLERAEHIDALRWIENDYNIKVVLTDLDSIEINTPEDILRIIG